MNPFDLDGSSFLVAYILFGSACLCLYLWWRRRLGADAPFAGRMADPYAIAYLRGGPVESVRVAVVSLLHRGLLERHDDRVKAVTEPAQTAHTLERVVLAEARSRAAATSSPPTAPAPPSPTGSVDR